MQNYSTEDQVGGSISSDRLRKAIERNRAKQLKRSRQESHPPVRPPTAPPTAPPPLPQDLTDRTMRHSSYRAAKRQHVQSNVPPRAPAPVRSQVPSRPPRPQRRPIGGSRPLPRRNFRAAHEEVQQPKISFFNRFSKVAKNIRKTVGRVGEIEFAGQIRKGKKAPANPTYDAKARRRVKKNVPDKWVERLVITGWIFCTFVLFRLVFADRGVVDYYKKKEIITQKENHYNDIEDENLVLSTEIEKITTDKSYQKKIVRDHLGFIAKNEYLIMFAGER